MTPRIPLVAFFAVAFLIPGAGVAERGLPAGPRMVGRVSSSFQKLDRDGDGRLSFGEWYGSLRGREAKPSKAQGFFRASDLNRNQRLSPYEFARSQGFRISLPNSQSRPGGRGEGSQGATIATGSQGATFTTGSGGGSNTSSGLPGGSSLTKVLGSTGGTLIIRGAGGGNSVTNSVAGTVSNPGSITKLGAGAVSLSNYTNTLELGSGNLTIGTLNLQTLLTGSGTTNSTGNTLPGSGSLTVNAGGTIQMGTIQTGTIQTGTIQTGTIQTGTIQMGTIQMGTIQMGTIQMGTIQGGTLVISGTFSRYVGLTLEAATALAESESRASRVVSIDGVRQTVTMDWSPTRVNFFLVDGIVKLAIGG